MTHFPARLTAGALVICLLLGAACAGPAPRQEGAASAPTLPAEPPATAAARTAPPPVATPPPLPAAAEVAAPAPTPAAAVPSVEATPPEPAPVAVTALHPFRPAEGRSRVVALDPGHGGDEVGAAGAGVAEKDVNLRIARKLRDLLEREGYTVLLARDGDRRATPPPDAPRDTSGRPTRADLQARIDIANLAGADVYLSIHNNGSPNPGDSGTETWWDGRRPWAAYNRALAEHVQGALVAAIRATGYPVIDRGLKEDSQFRIFQGRAFPIFVLGPPRAGASTSRAVQMPAVLGESLFLSNAVEAQWLARDNVQDAIARGYRDALVRYFRLIDEGRLAPPPGGFPPERPNVIDVTPPAGGSGGA